MKHFSLLVALLVVLSSCGTPSIPIPEPTPQQAQTTLVNASQTVRTRAVCPNGEEAEFSHELFLATAFNPPI